MKREHAEEAVAKILASTELKNVEQVRAFAATLGLTLTPPYQDTNTLMFFRSFLFVDEEGHTQKIPQRIEVVAPPTTTKELVDHPVHYNQGPLDPDGTAKYEAVKVIEDWSLGFKLGNALKYILRGPHKGEGEKRDLSKALWYINRQINTPDHPDRDGPERSMTSGEVAEAWGLNDSLAMCLHYLRHGDARAAVLALDAYVHTLP